MADINLREIAEHVVWKTRLPDGVPRQCFHTVRADRRRLGLDDWSEDIGMVLAALNLLMARVNERDQLTLPETRTKE